MHSGPFDQARNLSADLFFSHDFYRTLDPRSSHKWPEWYFARGFGVRETIFRAWYKAYSKGRDDGKSHETSLTQIPDFLRAFQSVGAERNKEWWVQLAHIRLEKKYRNKVHLKAKASSLIQDPMPRRQLRQTPQSQHSYDHILWLPAKISKNETIDKSDHLPCRIPLDSEAHGKLCPPWFEKSRLDFFLDKYPGHLAYYKRARGKNGRVTAYLHQSIVLAEILRHDRDRSIHYAADLPEAQSYLMQHAKESENWLVLLNLNGNPDPGHVHCVYTELERTLATYCGQKSEIMPPRIEWDAERHRMADIKVLDKIAKIMGTWRPRTCFSNFSQNSKCTLTDIGDTVTKETYTTDSTGFEAFLDGETPGSHEFISSDTPFKRYTIHQEYVPSLRSFGELRVTITTNVSPEITSGRGLQIEGAIKTSWVESNPELYMYVAKIGENDRWEEYPDLTQKMLCEYALEVYRLLLAEDRPFLKSLLIASRLDIGVDKYGRGFFVNEITRFTMADYLSEETQPKPHDRICKGIARALNEVYPAPARST